MQTRKIPTSMRARFNFPVRIEPAYLPGPQTARPDRYIYGSAARLRVKNLSPAATEALRFPTPFYTFLATGDHLLASSRHVGPQWSTGRGSGSRSDGGSDLERQRRVRSDGARKRGARRWTNCGMSPPASFQRSETEEYDRRRASFSSARCSYAGSSSSCGAGLLPVKTEWSEDEEEPDEFDFVPVKEEPAPLGRRGVVGPEDYVADVDTAAAAIAEWIVREKASCRGARRPPVAAGGRRQGEV
ncbi:CDPK-related protein kinase [Hordeum vulgare]|nr:CDPK-related protein kinase [Hordeum vulgare]